MSLSRRSFVHATAAAAACFSLPSAMRASVPSQGAADNGKKQFRNYDAAADHVTHFYQEHHKKQTYEFAAAKRKEYGALNRGRSTVWEMSDVLDDIHDNSDPDISLTQKEHAFQVAQSLREKDLPDWMVLAGFIHDLGKALVLWGEPQWAVVGDSFPVGMKYSPSIVHSGFLEDNPDKNNKEFHSDFGVYRPGIGLDNVVITWGHDEYLYQVLSSQTKLPEEALQAIRYHSLYPLHTAKEPRYMALMSADDEKILPWIQTLNSHDLYSKTDQSSTLMMTQHSDYYRELIEKYTPGTLRW